MGQAVNPMRILIAVNSLGLGMGSLKDSFPPKPETLLTVDRPLCPSGFTHSFPALRVNKLSSQNVRLVDSFCVASGEARASFSWCGMCGRGGTVFPPWRKLLMAITLKHCYSNMTSLLLHCRSDYSLAKYWHGLFYLMLVSRPKSPSIYRLLTHWC